MNRSSVACVAIVLLLAGGCGEKRPDSPIVARVGDATLSLADLQERVPPEILSRADRGQITDYVNQWVRNELLYQEARSMGYASDKRVKQRLEDTRRDIIVDTYLEDELDLRQFVTEQEIASYWEHNQDEFRRSGPEIQYRILWFADRAHASAARTALSAGRTFAEASVDTSLHVVSFDRQESFVSRSELGDDMGDLLFRQRVGQVSQPIALGESYLLVEVPLRAEAGTVRTLEEVHDDILSRLLFDLRDMKMDEILNRLLDTSQVTVDIDRALGGIKERDRP